MFNLNNRGFNLFTAMVSLILIAITLVLIFNMIKTEETHLALIEDQSSTSDLITVADLARADAFNLFVVSLREKWEEHRNNPDNFITINRRLVDLPWPEFVDEMGHRVFFERNFQGYFAENLLSKLRYSPNPVGYNINVETDLVSDQNFYDIVREMFVKAGEKVEVVGCEQEDSDKCAGSFYITLNAKDIEQQDYENLPRVTVQRIKNNEVIQRSVFGKQIYKIYMPWRGFQAFRVARRIAYSQDREVSENPALYPGLDDTGLFNPILHNTLEQARLGVCDKGTCAPRDDLFITPSNDGFNKKCDDPYTIPNVTVNGGAGLTISNGTKINFSETQNYTTNSDPLLIFQNIVETTIQNNLENRTTENIVYTNPSNQSLVMSGGISISGSADIKIKEINVYDNKFKTKKVGNISTEDKTLTQISSVNFSPLGNWNNAWGVGLYLHNDNIFNAYNYPDWNITRDAMPYTNSSDYLNCYEISEIKLKLEFQEQNSRYKVRETINGSNPKIHIHLVDNYSGFVFNTSLLSSMFSSGLDGSGYLNPGQSVNYTLTDESQWTCDSYEGTVNNQAACVQK